MSNTIGLFYSFNSVKTRRIVEMIKEVFSGYDIHDINVEDANEKSLEPYDKLILGSSTWFDGELPNYWDEFLPALEDLDFTGKKIALFGLGDQKNYSENFCDAIGILGEFFEKRGAEIIGKFPIDGFLFEKSKALRNNQFLGLPIDQENLSEITENNIRKWVDNLKKEFT